MTPKRTNASFMAKKRLKYKCEFCPKRYATLQGKFGHYPSCPNRKLSLEPATQAKPEPPSSTFEHRDSRRPGPDSQDMKLELLNANEDIIRLYRDAEDHTFWADFFSCTARNHVEGHATPEEWGRLAQNLGDIERDLDQMKGRLRHDRSLLFNIYHRMLAIQDAWLNYQARDFSRAGEVTPKGEDVLRAEQARFADLMLKIKRMVVAAR